MQAQTVSRSEWLEARLALMEKERALTLLKDETTAQRQALPLVAVEKNYRFKTEAGEKSLAELFGACEQLIVYHFMFGPDWDQGCPSCSFWADNYNGTQVHLQARNTQLVAVSNAPLQKLLDYRRRLGWSFDWVSAYGSSFTGDFGASFYDGDTSDCQRGYNYSDSYNGEESPGISTFVRLDDGRIAHSYSTFARGLEPANGAYHLLDMTALGRSESELPYTMAWIKRNDEYAQSRP
jgi:predicted dithiol-disulfide oxidoreductase (DUF899 family)